MSVDGEGDVDAAGEASTMGEHDGSGEGLRSIRAVIDRIVDGEHGVLLVDVPAGAPGADSTDAVEGTDEAEPREVEVVLPVALLPEGAAEGDWLRLDLTLDAARTQERRESLEERLARIRAERGGSRFV